MKKIYLMAGAALCLGLTSCFDIDQEPQGELSTVGAFATTSEIRMYLNMFYEGSIPVMDEDNSTVTNTVIKTQPVGERLVGIAYGDVSSDNLLPASVDERMNGATLLAEADELDDYKAIRNLNFLLQNIENCEERGTDYEQYLGEAYYFRAAFYYHLLVNYGGVTWTDQLYDPDAGQLQLPRDSRSVVADSILSDLDRAITYLNEESTNATMRVHKDVARALKSEVALFAATWEKYHFQKGTDFYDKGLENRDAKITDWLTQARDAAKAVMDRNVWDIYNTGNADNDYRNLFITPDLTGNEEVLWWKRYDVGSGIAHSISYYIGGGGGGFGVSASLVDDYLTDGGEPFVGSDKQTAKQTYGNEFNDRDPRLKQTVCSVDQQMVGGETYDWPPLTATGYQQNSTGYSMLKYLQTSSTDFSDAERQSTAPAIQVRYADVLLNYAEALAELDPNGNKQEIIDALKPLRDRVGMAPMDFDREFNNEADYPFKDLDPVIQAVRRERRVEKALENCRLTDILRWAAADVLIAGKYPKGALFTGSTLGAHFAAVTSIQMDAEGYILSGDKASYPNGWGFQLDRDYLLPIRQEMVGSLTGGKWTQNPGW